MKDNFQRFRNAVSIIFALMTLVSVGAVGHYRIGALEAGQAGERSDIRQITETLKGISEQLIRMQDQISSDRHSLETTVDTQRKIIDMMRKEKQ